MIELYRDLNLIIDKYKIYQDVYQICNKPIFKFKSINEKMNMQEFKKFITGKRNHSLREIRSLERYGSNYTYIKNYEIINQCMYIKNTEPIYKSKLHKFICLILLKLDERSQFIDPNIVLNKLEQLDSKKYITKYKQTLKYLHKYNINLIFDMYYYSTTFNKRKNKCDIDLYKHFHICNFWRKYIKIKKITIKSKRNSRGNKRKYVSIYNCTQFFEKNKDLEQIVIECCSPKIINVKFFPDNDTSTFKNKNITKTIIYRKHFN